MDWLPSRESVVLFLLSVVAAFLQPLLLMGILALSRCLWPTRDSPFVLQREEELRRRYGRALSDIEAWVVVLTMAGLVAVPFLVFQAVCRLAQATSQAGDGWVFFYGFPPIWIPTAIGGYLFPVALGPLFIRLTQKNPAREGLLWLWSLGDREEAGLGRYVVRRASRIALGFLLVPLVLAGDRYTVVGPRGIDVRRGAWSREFIPRGRVVAAGMAIQTNGPDDLCLLLDNGQVLDNRDDGDGRLSGFSADSATPALLSLHTSWQLPVQTTTDKDESACALAHRAAERAQGR